NAILAGKGWDALQEDECHSDRKDCAGERDGGFRQFEIAAAFQDRRQEIPVIAAFGVVCGGITVGRFTIGTEKPFTRKDRKISKGRKANRGLFDLSSFRYLRNTRGFCVSVSL